MYSQSPLSSKKGDWKKIHDTRKQVIQCESIIRKALAIHNCLNDLKQFEENQVLLTSNSAQYEKSRSTTEINGLPPITYPTQHNTIDFQSTPQVFKPVSSHISTPLFNRSSSRHTVPMVSNSKPVSQHIPTPIPSHQHSVKRTNSVETTCYSPTLVRQQFSEASFHTPTKRRNTNVCVYGLSDERHIQWIDKQNQPLVQRTPPPYKPHHRDLVALKPCVQSPDGFTKRRLESQRLAMKEKELSHSQELEKKKAHLF